MPHPSRHCKNGLQIRQKLDNGVEPFRLLRARLGMDRRTHTRWTADGERAGRSSRPAGGQKRFRPRNPTQLVSHKTVEREAAPPEPSRSTATAHRRPGAKSKEGLHVLVAQMQHGFPKARLGRFWGNLAFV